MSYLEKLIGHTVKNSQIESGSFLFMKKVEEGDAQQTAMEVEETHIEIGPFKLVITNPYTLMGHQTVYELKNLKVESVDERNDFAKIEFEKGTLIVDLRPESFRGPEAMALYGPEMFFAVWN